MKVRINFFTDGQFQPLDFVTEMNKDIKLQPNFTLGELANLRGDPTLPMFDFNVYSIVLVGMLQRLRDIVKRPITVNSGYRQEAYNAQIGGDKRSGHLRGWAVDIGKIAGFDDDSIAIYWRQLCIKYGFIGAINLYDTYYHLEINSDRLYGSRNFEIRDKRTKK